MAPAAAVPFAVAFVGNLLALWLGIRGGLALLERMRKVLAGRRPGEDAPLPPMSVPREMRPLVDTIGSLLERERSTLQALDLALRQCRLDPTAAAEPTAPASEVLAILITPTIGALNCATKKPIQLVGCVSPR